MRSRRLLGAGLLVALLGCGGAAVRPQDDAVARALGGPVARGLVTGAPEAARDCGGGPVQVSMSATLTPNLVPSAFPRPLVRMGV